VVKAAFIPKRDAFLFADYPSIEMKVLAFFLDSIEWPEMAELYRRGGDLYRESVSAMFGKLPADLTDEERQVGKVLNLSTVYGGGVRTIMEQLSVDAPTALAFIKAYHAKWPGIGWETKRTPAIEGTLNHLIKARIEERGYIATPYGRHLHPKAAHAAINNLCQGTAADLMKWAMVRVSDGLRNGGFASRIVNMVHDELMFDCAAEEVPELAVLIPEWMTDPRLEAVVPIKPECEVSYTTWADKEPYRAG
jgi:DNA polymerase-1